MRKEILVTGAGGFIGGHLVKRLLDEGRDVLSVDKKPFDDWYQYHENGHNLVLDVSSRRGAGLSVQGMDEVYNLAADMGGMGFIENNKAACMLSVLTSTNVINEALRAGVKRYFYSSSACVYAGDRQTDPNVTALKEEDAYPADPEDGYGWEKLFSERMAHHFYEDFGLETRVARYHNVYGPDGTWDGGREKAPAAICRKIAIAKATGFHEIEIWGDGNQTRSFMYIDDCIDGTRRLMDSDIREPLNIGSSELVSINQMVTIVEQIAGISVGRKYNLDAPQGVRGRNSDNTKIKELLDWEPSITLVEGLTKTYEWIERQVVAK